VLADEAGWRSMLSHVGVRCIVHWVTSSKDLIAAGSAALLHHCIAFSFFIHASKSSGDSTERYAFML
jgi:hypothetical protein